MGAESQLWRLRRGTRTINVDYRGLAPEATHYVVKLPDIAGGGEPARAAVVTGLLDGEPVFVMRARDAASVMVVNHYRQVTEGLFNAERAAQLEADVQEMIDWRHENQALVRDPD